MALRRLRKFILPLILVGFVASTAHAIPGKSFFEKCMRRLRAVGSGTLPDLPVPTLLQVKGEFDHKNDPSLAIPEKSYTQEIARSEKDLINAFGEGYTGLKLKKGARIIDSGSGLSLAAIQLAEKGFHTVGISPHSFWDGIVQLAQLDDQALKLNPIDSYVPAAGAISASRLADVARTLGIKPNKAVNYTGEETSIAWEKATFWTQPEDIVVRDKVKYDRKKTLAKIHYLTRSIMAKRSELERSGAFSEDSDRSENVLPDYRGECDLIIDLFGAGWYVADKAAMVNHYYDALAPGGKALMLLHYWGSATATPKVVAGENKRVELWKYLEEKYPTVFRVRTDKFSSYLEITKDPKIEKLDLPLFFLRHSVTVKSPETIGYPDNLFYMQIDSGH